MLLDNIIKPFSTYNGALLCIIGNEDHIPDTDRQMIKTSSGDINVIDVSGIVTIIDKNGDVFINGAKDFNITKRGSGDVESRNINSKLM